MWEWTSALGPTQSRKSHGGSPEDCPKVPTWPRLERAAREGQLSPAGERRLFCCRKSPNWVVLETVVPQDAGYGRDVAVLEGTKRGVGALRVFQQILKSRALRDSATVGRLSVLNPRPFLTSGTVRDNVLFGLPRDDALLEDVLERCALEKDLVSLRFSLCDSLKVPLGVWGDWSREPLPQIHLTTDGSNAHSAVCESPAHTFDRVRIGHFADRERTPSCLSLWRHSRRAWSFLVSVCRTSLCEHSYKGGVCVALGALWFQTARVFFLPYFQQTCSVYMCRLWRIIFFL